MVVVVIPLVILRLAPPVKFIWDSPTPFDLLLLLLGFALIAFGLCLMVKTNSLFATVGQGTLAPWAPPQKLVVRGMYCHVRNPMISGVFSILLGEVALSGSLPLCFWFLGFVLSNWIYIPFIEEPALERRFGQDYLLYKANVPRWIPRLKAWNQQNL